MRALEGDLASAVQLPLSGPGMKQKLWSDANMLWMSAAKVVLRVSGQQDDDAVTATPQVIEVIDDEAVPLLKRCSLAGHAQLKTSNSIFGEHSQAADMLIDILTDRGFSVAHTVDERVIPVSAMPMPLPEVLLDLC